MLLMPFNVPQHRHLTIYHFMVMHNYLPFQVLSDHYYIFAQFIMFGVGICYFVVIETIRDKEK